MTRLTRLAVVLSLCAFATLAQEDRTVSKNGRYVLRLGRGASVRPPGASSTPLRQIDGVFEYTKATVLETNGVQLWQRSIQVRFPGWLSPQHAVISEDGAHFALLTSIPEAPYWEIYSQEGNLFTLPCPSTNVLHELNQNAETLIANFTLLKKDPVFRVWDCTVDRWAAISLNTDREIEITPALASDWNDEIRKTIRAHIDQREAMDSQNRLPKWLQRFRLVVKPVPNISDLEYEFLAARRHRSDRPLLEALWTKDDSWHIPPADVGYFFRPNQQSFFGLRTASYQAARADHFTAIWENKIPCAPLRPAALITNHHTIGAITGRVQLPTPLTVKPGRLRIYLIPAALKTKSWVERAETGILCHDLPAANEYQGDLIDSIPFSYETVRAGDYFLKAIWDRRPPFDNIRNAGPGDYETDLVGPIKLAGGASIKNILLNCTNRSTEGATYYAADEFVRQQWRLGKINCDQFLPYEFTRPLRDWIIQTNMTPLMDACIQRITVLNTRSPDTVAFRVTGFVGPSTLANPAIGALGLEIGFGHLLYQPVRPNAALVAAIRVQSPSPTSRAGGFSQRDETFAITFNAVPRTNQVFHLLGYATVGPNRDRALFDFTITNLFQNAEFTANSPAFVEPPEPPRPRISSLLLPGGLAPKTVPPKNPILH